MCCRGRGAVAPFGTVKAIQLVSVLVVLSFAFFGCGPSAPAGGTGGGAGGGGAAAMGTTFSGGVTGTTVAAQVSAQSLTSGGSTTSSVTISLMGQAISAGTVSMSSQNGVAASLTATTYNSSNMKFNDSNVRLDGKEWDEVLSSDSAGNKGSLTVTFTSLGTPETSGGGAAVSYPHPKGSYTLVLKSTASDADVTVTGTFDN